MKLPGPPISTARSPSTFQPPSLCQDCVLGVASQAWSFRNITASLLGQTLYGLQDAAGQGRVAGRGQGVRDG